MKKQNKKGFTLAELLIVLAIIAVLVAIMLPVFSAQLNKARATAELANVRAKYSELVVDQMMKNALDDGAVAAIVVKKADLQAATKYDDTVVAVNNTTKTVTVTYGTVEPGTFTVDADVELTETE